MVSAWFQHGFNMVSTWFQHGFNMVSTWFQRGFNVVSTFKHGFNFQTWFQLSNMVSTFKQF
jgi:hypothetical protein